MIEPSMQSPEKLPHSPEVTGTKPVLGVLQDNLSKQAIGGGAGRRRGKMVIPLLSTLAILSMVVAAVAIVFQMKERDKREATERELAVVQTQKKDLEGQLEQVRQEKSAVEMELTRVRTDFDAARKQLAQAIEAQEVLTKQVNNREVEIERLTKDLDQRRNEHQQLAEELNELRLERDDAENRLAHLEKTKIDLEDQVFELSERPTVELEKVLVTSEQVALGKSGGVVSTTLNGEIIVVNHEYDFIVMNLGRDDGLSIGQEFKVVRGAEVLGRVKVEKIYDELSAAAILPESQEENIREGDSVISL